MRDTPHIITQGMCLTCRAGGFSLSLKHGVACVSHRWKSSSLCHSGLWIYRQRKLSIRPNFLSLCFKIKLGVLTSGQLKGLLLNAGIMKRQVKKRASLKYSWATAERNISPIWIVPDFSIFHLSRSVFFWCDTYWSSCLDIGRLIWFHDHCPNSSDLIIKWNWMNKDKDVKNNHQIHNFVAIANKVWYEMASTWYFWGSVASRSNIQIWTWMQHVHRCWLHYWVGWP